MTTPTATSMRSQGAGTLRAGDADRAVALCGWVHRRRDHGGIVFFDLRDRYGIVQCVANPERLAAQAFAVVEKLRPEDVVRIEGTVTRRPAGSANAALETGEIEVHVTDCALLAASAVPPFPVDVEKEGGEVAEDLRLRYRYLELRRPDVAAPFGMRHRIAFETRRYFDQAGFWEVETPMLTRKTPEGARDYLVPSRVHPGAFYALPQSPQLYKQLLMVAGFDRYFQIARCFRDEDLRADRQPEFTQIDIEMSFVDQADVLAAVDGLFRHLFRSCLGVEIGDVPRLTHEEALARFGSDKPDLRIPHELVDLTERFRDTGFRVFDSVVSEGGRVVGLRVPGGADASRGQIDKWTEAAKGAGAKGLVWGRRGSDGWSTSVDKFVDPARWGPAPAVSARLAGGPSGPLEAAGAETGDLVLAVADRTPTAQLAMGALRFQLARERGWIDESAWKLLWVVDFPLFEDDGSGRPVASHHPFCMPSGGMEALSGDLFAIRAKAYDLVLNGYELGSGSTRIHDRAIQEKVFELLGVTRSEAEAKFGFLLQAFEYGAPPHGGFAIGLDRVAMLFASGTSLRDVIAFPKTTSATGLMEGAPTAAEDGELAHLHIQVVQPTGANE